jgi:hypothetical protein
MLISFEELLEKLTASLAHTDGETLASIVNDHTDIEVTYLEDSLFEIKPDKN